ncbi:MAG: ThuA domain-containing protein [Planctomycetaceae bacterium]|nr:ThuA domain-containing protein [Planctomycetaceae bacterium]
MRLLLLKSFIVTTVILSSTISISVAEEKSPKKILLIAQGPDHPYRTHCYVPDCELLAKCLKQTPGIETIISRGWPEDEKVLDDVDSIVLHVRQGGNLFFHPSHRKRAIELMEQGVGLVAVHWGTGADNAEAGTLWRKALGGHFNAQHFSKYTVTISNVKDANQNHPVSRGWETFELRDEFYYDLKFEEAAVPLSTVKLKDKVYPVSWTFERKNKGRSFAIVAGHFHDNFAVDPFRQMIVNGILWTAKVKIPEQGAPIQIVPEDLDLTPEFEKLNNKK